MIYASADLIKRAVAVEYGISPSDFVYAGKSKDRIAHARQIVHYLMREYADIHGKRRKWTDIARTLKCDHSTVIFSCREAIPERLQTDPELAARIASIRQYIAYALASEQHDAISVKSAAQSAMVFNTGVIPPNPAPVNSAGRATPILVAPSRSFFPILPYVSSRQNGPGRLPSPPAPRPSGVLISGLHK